MNGRAREDRGQGQPLGDVERACRHYNITEEEYCAHPERYPLPQRGTGLTSGNLVTGLGIVGLIFAVSIVVAVATTKRR